MVMNLLVGGLSIADDMGPDGKNNMLEEEIVRSSYIISGDFPLKFRFWRLDLIVNVGKLLVDLVVVMN